MITDKNFYTKGTAFINYWKCSHNITTIKILYINTILHTEIFYFAKKNIDNMLVQLAINVEHLNFIPHSTLYYIFCSIFNSNKLATYFVWSPTKTINLYGLIDMTTRLGFPTSYVEVFSYVQWVKVWGDHCSFCWYWWKCWPSLLKCTVNSFLFNVFMIFFNYFLWFVISWFANLAMWFKHVFQYQLRRTLKRSCIFRELLTALVQ